MTSPKPSSQCPVGGRWAAPGRERADVLEAHITNAQSGVLVTVPGHVGDLPNVRQAPNAGQATNVDSISTWLTKRRVFHAQHGGLRMLICDRIRYGLELPIKEETFKEVIREFKLSPKTLQSFDCDSGTFSRSYVRNDTGGVTGIRIILKAPQKREAGNYGLSMHYDFATGVTTALLFATDAIVCQQEPHPLPGGETDIRNVELPGHPNLALPAELEEGPTDDDQMKEHKKVEREKWHFDNIHQKNNPDNPRHLDAPKDHFQRAQPKLLDLVATHINRLNHPLALPGLLLGRHLDQVHEACEHGLVPQKTWEIMNELSMRSDDRGEEHLFWIDAMGLENAFTEQGAKDRFDAKNLTAKLDRHVLRIMFWKRSPEWNASCSKFLLGLSAEINKKVPSAPTANPPQQAAGADPLPRFHGDLHDSIEESLEYNAELSSSLLARLETMHQNMQLQLDVCGAITGQSANEFNARIAWDTSRDSTSMKILAVITAAFLPGTFVATFMSMSVWNWQWSDDPGPQNNHQNQGVVSPHWTIYIKAAIPLTVATLIGWMGWWIFEIIVRENNYMKTVDTDVEGSMVETRVRRVLRWRRDMRAALAVTRGNLLTRLFRSLRDVWTIHKKERRDADERKEKLREERKGRDRDKWQLRKNKHRLAQANAANPGAPATTPAPLLAPGPGAAGPIPAAAPSQHPNGSPV